MAYNHNFDHDTDAIRELQLDVKPPTSPPPLSRRQNGLRILIGTILAALASNVVSHTAPDTHPFLFALAASWMVLILTVVLLLSFRQLGSYEVPFAAWERDGTIYRCAGVVQYRWILLHSPFAWLFPDFKLYGGRSDLPRVLRRTYGAEIAHVIAAILNVILAGVLIGSGYGIAGIWALLINVPFNVYIIILQRWNRGRILRLLQQTKKN